MTSAIDTLAGVPMMAKSSNRKKPRSRIGKALLVVLAPLILGACKTDLYTALSENDANEIMAILIQNGIDGSKRKENKTHFSVQVERTQIADAIQLLKEYGYPKEQFKNIGEIFAKQGLISSPLEERSRFIFALRESIQEMLSRIDGVLTARVNVVLPDNNPYAEQWLPSSAAVFIKYHPESTVPAYKSEIKTIVAKSIEGLTYDKVTLLMVPAMTPPEIAKAIPWKTALGLRLAPDSLRPFWLMVMVSVAVLAIVGCSLALVWTSRSRTISKAFAGAEPTPDSADGTTIESRSPRKLLDTILQPSNRP